MTDYPNDADGDALRRIANDGSDVSQPIEVDFTVDAGSSEAGHRIAAAAEELGYRTRVAENDADEEGGEDDDLAGRWTVYCTRDIVLTYQSVMAAQAELDRISAPFGGRTDGWGTFGHAAAE